MTYIVVREDQATSEVAEELVKGIEQVSIIDAAHEIDRSLASALQ
ncbi:MAG: hypothetical protein QM811_16330 [Pirellulales bacterium]